MEAPLIDVPDGTITTPRGFLAGATAAGIRSDTPGRLDLALLVSEQRCAAAAVYTTNRFQAPPLRLTQRHLAGGRAQAVVVNTGCANALTGGQGKRDAQEMAELTAAKLDLAVDDVVVASTGVTGWLLPMERIRDSIGRILPTEDGGDAFAHAIMTTDTVAKQAAVQFEWDGVTYAVGGAAKGAGMIHVNMATMLAFLTTDAPVDGAVLTSLLRETVDASFNQLTIDNATSTNDMALLLASGAAGGETIGSGHPALPLLGAALQHVAITLTRKLARDGEGASKLLEVRVDGAASIEDARRAAKTVAGSMLLKAAVFGNDPNWGRVLDAIGYSDVEAEEERLALAIQAVEVYRDGEPVPFDEGALSQALAHGDVHIRVDLGAGEATATAWGCDLTPEYVRINSEYTT
jgi:glutamate N-acetyltransferase/amino-acid N-acetyltransferase